MAGRQRKFSGRSFLFQECRATCNTCRLRGDAAADRKGGSLWQRTTAYVWALPAGASGTVRMPDSHGHDIAAPFPLNSRIQALVAHPTQAHTVFAGGDTGLFASHDGGARWGRIGANAALPTIWSLTIDPVDPDILFAGTRPAGIYRSRDGGGR